jgi:hypothetical protein
MTGWKQLVEWKNLAFRAWGTNGYLMVQQKAI